MSDPATAGTIYRIVWSPGSDRLHGVCHCGAEHVADDPVQMWDWLLAHPDHEAAAAGGDPWWQLAHPDHEAAAAGGDPW